MLPYIPDVVPNIVVALVIVVAFVMAFAPALRKCPVAFYAVWIAACMATFVDIVRWIPWLYYVVQAFASCYTGVAFYLLVMFAGAFPKKWWFTKRLLSVRTEMSIIGGFVIFAHVIQVLIMVPLLSLLFGIRRGVVVLRQSSCSLLRASWGCRLRCASLCRGLPRFARCVALWSTRRGKRCKGSPIRLWRLWCSKAFCFRLAMPYMHNLVAMDLWAMW